MALYKFLYIITLRGSVETKWRDRMRCAALIFLPPNTRLECAVPFCMKCSVFQSDLETPGLGGGKSVADCELCL